MACQWRGRGGGIIGLIGHILIDYLLDNFGPRFEIPHYAIYAVGISPSVGRIPLFTPATSRYVFHPQSFYLLLKLIYVLLSAIQR